MLCKEIIEIIESTYPKHAACEWDNVGLLVGRMEKEVQKIYVALDATDEVVAEAAAIHADMLITHHPLIFSPMKKITDDHFMGKRVVTLLQHDISYYAMHTNYDVLGMAELAGKLMSLQHADVLEITDVERHEGIGRIGELEREMTLEECCNLVKRRFHLPAVRLFGEKNSMVNRAAISPGSGKSMIGAALEKKAEVLITGDIDHHEGIDAVARNLAIIDAGHYGLEHIFIEDMVRFLQTHIHNVQIEKTGIVHPFQIL